MKSGFRFHLFWLFIFWTVASLNSAQGSERLSASVAGLCQTSHLSAPENRGILILPTYIRKAPFDGTIQLKTPDGSIVNHNVMRRPTIFLNRLDETAPVQKSYNIIEMAGAELLPMVSISPKVAPPGTERLPLDVPQLYEEALSDVFQWSQEKREAAKAALLTSSQFQKSSKEIESRTSLPHFLKPIFPRFHVSGDVVFAQLKVQFAPSQVHSVEADMSRALLDVYFTSLQRAYRQQGDSRLGKAIKLLDSWVQSQREQRSVSVHLMFDRALWNRTMNQLEQVLQMPDFQSLNSFQRTELIHSQIRSFLPLGGMMTTSIDPQTIELGRRFTNSETDPLRIQFENGQSPLRGQQLQTQTTNFYRWIVEALPSQTTLWARAFSPSHANLFQRNGFREPAHPSSVYVESKKAAENYWNMERSWLMEQPRDQWLRFLSTTDSQQNRD